MTNTAFTFCLLFILQSLFLIKCTSIYCGDNNCYELLKVERDAEKSQIAQAYRRLARIHHPDRQKTPKKKAEAETMFMQIANAYEILRDDEQRKEYDYMLDHPEEMYYHYYRYYKRRYSPKVDVRIVIVVIITLVSVAQYYGQWANYNEAMNYIVKDSKYRHQAKEIARQEGRLLDQKKRENGRRITKEDMKEREEKVIREIIEEKMDIRGGYEKPCLQNTLWLMLILWPYWLSKWLYFQIRWYYKYKLKGQDYEEEDKLLAIRFLMRLSKLQWAAIEQSEKDRFMQRELWIKKNYEKYAAEKAIEMKKKLAEDPKYKRYRRYMKSGGPGQIVFGPEDGDGE